jgi:N-acetylglucosamine-6-phosphate deacetylase
MSSRDALRIVSGTLVGADALHENSSLWIVDGRIVHMGADAPEPREWPTVDASGLYVSPGFVDVHVHGGVGADFMDATTADALTIAEYHAAGGTTSLLATTATDSIENILAAVAAARDAQPANRHGARILGVHLEGPYFNPEKKGCHLGAYVRDPDPVEYRRLLADNVVRWMTLAPELPGAEGLVRALAAKNIVASAGHSNATFLQMAAAVAWGLRHSTHLYCAMSSVVKQGPQRRGGIVEASLLLDELTTELIADGVHLPPELMRLAVKCKGVEGVLLVTDAQRAAGMPDGEYEFGRRGEGTPFVVRDGVATTPDFTGYASSTVQMMDTVRVACERIGVSLPDAVRMASWNPANVLGLGKTLGSLELGKRADVVLFDDAWRVHRTIVGGRVVYGRT